MEKKKVVIGFLGTKLDAGFGMKRWNRWRPTVSLVQNEKTSIDRLELFYAERFTDMAKRISLDIQSLSPTTQVNLIPMELTNPWDFEEVYASVFDWAKQYTFNPEQEDYWIHITTGTHVAQICMFLLVEARYIPGILLQSSPNGLASKDPTGKIELIDLDLSRYDKLAQRFDVDTHDSLNFLKHGIATRNAKFNKVIAEIEHIAIRSKAPVLLVGPTGAGKSFLAKRIYELKKARHQIKGAFVEVNCATLRGDGATSTLFGHKKGSFTGAVADRMGLLRAANNGVLFLDEIGELGADEQAMLLKAIEEKHFLPLGSDSEVSSDFQLIAGTNRDLRDEVIAGNFREDLFARINLWTYELPSLCERNEDIEPNIDYLLELVAYEQGEAVHFNREAKAKFLEFAQSPQALWCGNFRDLTAAVTRMATLASSGRITSDIVEAEIQRLEWMWKKTTPVEQQSQIQQQFCIQLLGQETWDTLDLFDQLQLPSVIEICRKSRNMSEAGRKLFYQSRQQRATINDSDRLRKYLQKFGLTWEMIQ
ncbi:RNA repair transcriptional activator RtcR [Entomomonas asaccharolytica]|uniref:Sigma 54-interacting transcriptional regulator n=1 Tax=Entomomonas asaccharolytica TaxID=2785331 RepID=A0A974NH08_9GAMM|nr:RNA repair transcriptional activator RtcR [Entomomonas asaccharolytica]QQP86444.1 sigma 54-interacting transcriptional regulator [Entomomonas asaccharolytica]